MDRPPLEVADLVRAAGEPFIERNRHWMRWKHLKVLRAIARCRPTATLGGHLDECTRCGHRAISFNSCRDRHCPKCQIAARERWIASVNENFFRHVMCTWSSHSPAAWHHWSCRTRSSSTISCSEQRGNSSGSGPRPVTPRR